MTDPYRALCLALAVYCDVKGTKDMTDADWMALGFDPAEMNGKPTAWRLLKIRANIIISEAIDAALAAPKEPACARCRRPPLP